MQAIVKAKAELGLEEVPIPEVRGDDVRIRVLKTSICGTDVHIYNWDALGAENDSCSDDDRP
jgi:threonine 3-dehydrogenase